MGKLKVKNWQYQSKQQPAKQHDPGLMAAVQLANYQYKTQKKVREMIAIEKEVNQICIDNQNWAVDNYMNWDYGAVALVLHRRYGYSPDEIVGFLSDMQAIVKAYEGSGYLSEDIWNDVRDEVGLDIVVVGGESEQ